MSRPKRRPAPARSGDPMAPVVLFLDVEYSRRDAAHAALISFALVARDTDDELYVVLRSGWQPAQCSGFVRQAVLPQLLAHAPLQADAGEALAALETFIARLRTDPWQPVLLVSDWPADWDVLMQLPAAPRRWRDEHTVSPQLVHHLLEDGCAIGAFNAARDAFLENLSADSAAGPHHALVDARALRHAWHTIRSEGA